MFHQDSDTFHTEENGMSPRRLPSTSVPVNTPEDNKNPLVPEINVFKIDVTTNTITRYEHHNHIFITMLHMIL